MNRLKKHNLKCSCHHPFSILFTRSPAQTHRNRLGNINRATADEGLGRQKGGQTKKEIKEEVCPSCQ